MVLDKAVISLCIPCMNRTHDLKRTMLYTIDEANSSPPVEICVLNYNSQDDLAEFISRTKMIRFRGESKISYHYYTGRDYYHMTHAYNLAAKSSIGDYIVIMGADAIIRNGYINALRKLIADGCVWMRGRHKKGIVCVQRQEFIDAGGYDERMEFSGEDKDLDNRLRRRGGKFGLVPDGMVDTIFTPNSEKVKNRRVQMTKREMMLHGKRIRDENDRLGVLVANEGKDWGQWE